MGWVKSLSVLGETRGNGIKSSRIPGVAFCEAAQGEPGAVDGSVNLDGFQRIGRAARMETASASAVAAAGKGVQER